MDNKISHKLLKLLLLNKKELAWIVVHDKYRLSLYNAPVKFPEGMEEKDVCGKDIPYYLSLLNRNYGQGCVSLLQWGADHSYYVKAEINDYFKALWVDWLLDTMPPGSWPL